ncbi:hypothetical protein IAT38_002980 [Cryptococcus sp. DSM 104549]
MTLKPDRRLMERRPLRWQISPEAAQAEQTGGAAQADPIAEAAQASQAIQAAGESVDQDPRHIKIQGMAHVAQCILDHLPTLEKGYLWEAGEG